MKFGLFYGLQSLPGSGVPHQQLYKEMLEQVEVAEDLGYHSVSVAEHHFIEDGMCPSLLVTCAAIAARTKSMRIGTGCLLLPLYDPIHVAEDAAVVDNISGGRLTLAVTTGYV
ncbi:MAG: LLM class flavin-dependent oxidoreductase, partial [Candidatus Bathyarchaeia archaeon]